MKNIKFINSTKNLEIKEVIKILNSKKKTDKFIFQNIRAIETALNSGIKLYKIFLTEKNLNLVLDLLKIDLNLIRIVPEFIIDKISSLKNCSGIVAVFYIKENNIKDLKSKGLVLSDIKDPGNMGTLIRTAVSCNIKNIIIIDGVNPYLPKVIQASAGTIALANIYKTDWQNLILNKKNLKLCALVPKNGELINNIDINLSNILLIVGNEANGIEEKWLKYCDKLITLKMTGDVESLNAAVAGSIALYIFSNKN